MHIFISKSFDECGLENGLDMEASQDCLSTGCIETHFVHELAEHSTFPKPQTLQTYQHYVLVLSKVHIILKNMRVMVYN